MAYTPTTWVDGISAATAATMNNIETGVVALSARNELAALSTGNTAAQNTTAIQAALTTVATSGAEAILPGGTYDHNGFTFPAAGGITVRGTGRGRTILRNTHATNSSAKMYGTAGGPYSPLNTLSDMQLTCDTTRSGQVGLDLELANRFTIRDIDVGNHGVGVKHHAAWDGTYDTISVHNCTTGWNFPVIGSLTGSTPVYIHKGSAYNCTTGAQIDDGLEVLTWIGGDWNGNTAGLVITGNEVRAVLFAGINFERTTNDDVSIGDASTGPAAVTFQDCRFLRTTTGTRSAYFRRGERVVFNNCNWVNYTLAIRQDSSAGTLTSLAASTTTVTTFLDSNGTSISNASYITGSPNNPIRFDVNGASSFTRQLAAFDGLTTKNLSGAGKVTVADADFSSTPPNGTMAVVLNTTDSSVRHAVRSNGAWKISAAYT